MKIILFLLTTTIIFSLFAQQGPPMMNRPMNGPKMMGPKTKDNGGLWQQSRSYKVFEQEQNIRVFELSVPGTFAAVWSPTSRPPEKVLWLLHGTGGTAYDEIKDELEYARKNNFGLVGIQWRIGKDYLTPQDIYKDIQETKGAIQKVMNWPMQKNAILGFSRGSASSIELSTLDATSDHIFQYYILISGGAPLNAMVTKDAGSRDIFFAKFNKRELPKDMLKGITFWYYSGLKDEQWGTQMSDYMKNAKEGIEAAGGHSVEWINDPEGKHMTAKLNSDYHQRYLQFFIDM